MITLANGEKVQIGKLASSGHPGPAVTPVDNRAQESTIIGYERHVRTKNKNYYKIITITTAHSNAGGFQGPDLAPDQNVMTQMGLIPAKYIIPGLHKIITETPQANKDQLSVILGSLIGDGGFYEQPNGKVDADGGLTGLWFSQCKPRIPYATWKFESIKDLSPGHNIIKTAADGNKNEVWRYVLNFTRYFSWLRHKYDRRSSQEHGHRRLVITKEVLDSLGLLGLAVWYMDDGSFNESTHTAQITASKLTEEEIKLCTEFFEFHLGCIVPYRSSAKGFCFSRQAYNSLRMKIIEFIHPSVSYKMPGGPTTPFRITQPNDGCFAEEITSLLPVIYEGKYGDNTCFQLFTPTGNFLTLAGFIGC